MSTAVQLYSCAASCMLLPTRCGGLQEQVSHSVSVSVCASQCLTAAPPPPALPCRYLGNVTVVFDAQGNLQSAAGVPLLLGPSGSSSAMTKDPAMVALVAENAVPVVAAWTGKVGSGRWLWRVVCMWPACLLGCMCLLAVGLVVEAGGCMEGARRQWGAACAVVWCCSACR